MDFSSDTSAPAHPAVLEALAAANKGQSASYGADDWTRSVERTLADLFETDVAAWIVASGTAANALALSVMCPPTGAIACHHEAHIAVDERGAPEFYTGGAKLQLLADAGGKISVDSLKALLARRNPDFVHETPAATLSLTNMTEGGTVYSAAETVELTTLAKAHGLNVHLDGARIANALVSLKASPAELTWRAGVDVVTLGLTKTGAMGCEIIVLFGDMRARMPELKARAKRSGQMPPKARYLAAQAEALLDHGLWLDLAGQANATAQRVANVFSTVKSAKLARPVHGNEVFVRLPKATVSKLEAAGVGFYPWPDGSYRFVCSWATEDSEVDALKALLAG